MLGKFHCQFLLKFNVICKVFCLSIVKIVFNFYILLRFVELVYCGCVVAASPIRAARRYLYDDAG